MRRIAKPRAHRSGLIALSLLGALVALLASAPIASAANFQRPFEEVFGPAQEPTFVWPLAITVDPSGDDVLVGDWENSKPDSADFTIYRHNPDGTAAPFAALGSNAIDGKAGPGGKPCAEEPASCDKTPQDGLTASGQGNPQISVDPTNGNVYVTQKPINAVDIFSAEGAYLGQLTAAGLRGFNGPCGVVVDSSGAVYVAAVFAQGGGSIDGIAKFVPSGNPPVNADNTALLEVEPPLASPPSTASSFESLCQMALGSGPSAGWIFTTVFSQGKLAFGPGILKVNAQSGEFSEFVKGYAQQLTVDPTSGNPVVLSRDTQEATLAAEFDGSLATASSPLSRLVVEGHGNGIGGLAANASGEVYAITGPGDPHVFTYGHPAVVPTVSANPAANITGSSATLTGAVGPEGIAVSECFFEWGPTSASGFTKWEHEAPCEPEEIPTDSGEHVVHATIAGMTPNGAKYSFRLAARNENGLERSAPESLTTAFTVQTEAANPIGRTSATLNGTLRPEGNEVSQCYFEWGLATAAVLSKTPCTPPGPAIEADFSPHAVSAALSGLKEGAAYRFRLVTVDSEGTHDGGQLEFTTLGPPQLSEVRAFGATQTAASIGAAINPNGFGTSYRIEWGPTSAYGHQVPAEFEPFIGDGTTAVRISAKLTGLSPATTYHYRVIATSSAGVTASGDRTLETLGSCGLPEGRCFELVSRRAAGPVAIPGESIAPAEVHFQAAPQGPGTLAYVVEAGYPEATKGAEVLYRGTRGSGGWESTQLSQPIVAANEKNGAGSAVGTTEWLAEDISCGFAESYQPLTDDPAPRLTIEAGGSNLYRINPDNTYTAVSALAPENFEAPSSTGNFKVIGASQDCAKVLFTSRYRYPGVPATGNSSLYEWEEGALRNPGVIPGPDGDVTTSATGRAVSKDGSRVFFTATRQASSNPSEIGKQAVFVREDASTTRDLTLSQTATAAGNATYLWSSPDGSKVFFSANAGLTDETSSEGTDLYEYDFAKPEGERLTDLSVDPDAGGAAFNAFLGASADDSVVYFSARGQLIPGQGRTFADNESADTYSVYRAEEGEVSFAFTQAKEDLGFGISEVSAEGRYLLFESTADYTVYESGGAPEAYLFDSQASSEALLCVSCRPDGQPSLAPSGYEVLIHDFGISSKPNPVAHLAMREGRPLVLFSSPDPLAPGAVAGQNNVYEWTHGQVFRLTSAEEGQQSTPVSKGFALPVGISADGQDAYFVSPETLNWEDGDERLSVYDARIGGGFAEPPPPSAPCDPNSEGSCQGPAQAPPAPGQAASAAFNGPGNPPERASKQKSKKKKKHAKKKHAKKRKKHARKHKKRARGANAKRRAGK